MIPVIVQSSMHTARRRARTAVPLSEVPEVYPKRLASFLVWLLVGFVLLLIGLYPAP